VKEWIVVQGDSTTGIPVRDGAVDLVVTSPPYGVGKDYGRGSDGDLYGREEYRKFSFWWLSEVWRVSKEGGRLCVNVPLDTNVPDKRPVYYDVLWAAEEVGWKYWTTIIWVKQKVESLGTAPSGRFFGSWCSPSAPNVVAPVEVVLVLYKGDTYHRTPPPARPTDLRREEFLYWVNGVWLIAPSPRIMDHPAPFPGELVKRCVKLYSWPGDLVLDPFVGSGTTVVVCRELGRRVVGVELNHTYCVKAAKRVRAEGRRHSMKLFKEEEC